MQMTGSRTLLLKLPFEIQAHQEVRFPSLQSSGCSATLPKLFFVCFLNLIPLKLFMKPHCVRAWGYSHPGRLYFLRLEVSQHQLGVKVQVDW